MCDEDRKKKRDRDEDRRKSKERKPTIIDRIFALLEGPIANTLVKLIATGMISASTIALTGILAFASAPVSVLLTSVALGFLSTGLVWVFGGKKKQTIQSGKSTPSKEEVLALKGKLAELEDRLTNVEIIERFEDRLAAKAVASIPTSETTYASMGLESER